VQEQTAELSGDSEEFQCDILVVIWQGNDERAKQRSTLPVLPSLGGAFRI